MIHALMRCSGVDDAEFVMKIDDKAEGIEEGLNAGVSYVKKYVTKIHNALRDKKPKRGLILSLALM